ncbi:MAG: DeoR family transcriptional regulator [Anaerolineae bacterium]|nr:DeoR family transcriptional regulator [Anaerolineae bacterium]
MKTVTSNHKQTTRDVILHTLKSSNQLKVEELAEAADVSPVTVRHHLNSLQADGLIEVSSIRRKVGRPFYVYSLSEGGHELFPKKYVHLTNMLLDELKLHLPEEQVNELFGNAVQRIVEEHRSQFDKLPFEARLTYLMDMLADEGFLAKWEKTDVGEEYKIIQYSCPYLSVGAKHDEVCTLDKELIISVMQKPISQQSCMLEGDECCQFTISSQTIDLVDIN